MTARISREELVERVAQISHATYLLQAVRDQDKRLDEIEVPTVPDFPETPEREKDLARAQAMLEAVRDEGRSLEGASDRPALLPTDHDRERAENTVRELERLGLV